MSIKKCFLSITLIMTASTVSAQIPVTDTASLSQHLAQVAAWGEQLAQMKTQIDQQKQQYQAISGSRGLGSLLNDPNLKSALPTNWQKVYSAVQNGGYKGLTGNAKAIRDASKILDCTQGDPAAKILCERQAVKSAQDKAFAQAAYEGATARLDNIQQLMAQINETQDAKAIGELHARMQAEQAMIQNEQTKLQLFTMLVQLDKELLDQQKREQGVKELQRPSKMRDGSLKPVQF